MKTLSWITQARPACQGRIFIKAETEGNYSQRRDCHHPQRERTGVMWPEAKECF